MCRHILFGHYDHGRQIKMSHIGNYLKGKLGGSKAPKPPRRDYDGDRSNSDDSENDESYLDPTTVHPTSPAHGPIMPSYPPPRPNHSPATRRVQDPGKRASVPVTFDSQNRAPVPRARSQRPQSAEHLQLGKVPVPSQRLKVGLSLILVSYALVLSIYRYLPVKYGAWKP